MTTAQTQTAYKLLHDLLKYQLEGKTGEKQYRKLMQKSQEVEGVYPMPDAPWTDQARIAWLLALLPHIAPDLLDKLLREQLSEAGDFPGLGGVKGTDYRGILPTGETVLFLLGGENPEWRADARKLFAGNHYFAEQKLLELADVPAGEPRFAGKLVPDHDAIEKLLTGQEVKPHFSTRFPAERLITGLDWDDLVLDGRTMSQIKELVAWIDHGQILINKWGMGKRVKPGYRALFYGPPGTGKTLTASLLGKENARDVYRVDLSMVISKYIGETEKNLAALFAKAENKDWILFFDEADALFGKRTGVKDSNDRYGNQDVSYLLQRVETYNGLVILASNFKSNIDEAFMRRFQSVIYFPTPSVTERLRLWNDAWPDKKKSKLTFAKDCSMERLSRDYEVTGATINNVVQKVCLTLLDQGKKEVSWDLMMRVLRQEMGKEGKLI